MSQKPNPPDLSNHEECVGCYNFQCGCIIRPEYCLMECVTFSYTDKTGRDHFDKRPTQKCDGQKWKLHNVLWNDHLKRCVVIVQ